MEQEFYRDEFEQLLKDTTDDFKMYPSRKVWHSIYNDLHPDRKWPSFAVCLLLLTGILYVGVSNNNAINSNSHNNKMEYAATAANNGGAGKKNDKVAATDANNAQKNVQFSNADINATVYKIEQLTVVTDYIVPPIANTEDKVVVGISNETVAATTEKDGNSITIAESAKQSLKIIPGQPEELKESVAAVETADNTETNVANSTSDENAVTKPVTFNAMQPVQSTDNREWIDNFAFYNKKKERSTFKGGWSTQFYVAPSVGYRVLFRNEKYTPANENALIATNTRNNAVEKEPNEQGALSIEAGAGIIKEIGPRLRIKTGLQFNYSDFITNAQRLDHPTATTVAINNDYGVTMEDYSSMYSNTPGKNNDQLHNRTMQLSIPLGVDYKLMGNNKVSWYAGASFQPTYIAGGYAWVQSADNNFYVEDARLLRKWNFNAGIESFVSFKTPGGASINIGPQFRYQLMSTYTKRYTYTEKPYNIGFKIGLSKPL